MCTELGQIMICVMPSAFNVFLCREYSVVVSDAGKLLCRNHVHSPEYGVNGCFSLMTLYTKPYLERYSASFRSE
jgi:hypothetical protein